MKDFNYCSEDMHGNRHNHHGEADIYCVCPVCGYSEPHVHGVPCITLKCPTCHVALMREDKDVSFNHDAPNYALIHSEPSTPNISPKPFPKIQPEKCTGCGTCVSICPTDAIRLMQGKAFIEEALCRNCRKCVRMCPENAIV
ncbi:4Fe-4S binding protein [Microbacter margulisiae]|uniref:NAD-dependent dihydropyrimidine dehydrogenase PreA subunit n=1 Tax=Microbacter margulisiae TaxID=1350067 RepID=A0A7W5DP83_9PORP|nr:4Fe-4S binding protein [Microbacter margulisiae]MBB3186506.1 NAD-dependent dihydropyrimidine dehydrogenase PreA subunit [Microbacter margulisiae]